GLAALGLAGELDDLGDEFRARFDDLGGDGGADVAAGAAKRAALAFTAAGDPALGGQLSCRPRGEELGGSSLSGLEDRWIAADRVLVDRVPVAGVGVRDDSPLRSVVRKCVD